MQTLLNALYAHDDDDDYDVSSFFFYLRIRHYRLMSLQVSVPWVYQIHYEAL